MPLSSFSNALSRIILVGIGVCLLFAPLSKGQGSAVPVKQVNGTVNGNQRGLQATITVCAANAAGIPCAPALAGALFSNAALTTPLANPTQTDANGNYPVMFLAAGLYTITETASGFAGYTYQVSLPCASGQACTISTLNVTTLSVSGTATLPSPIINGTPAGSGIPTITLKKGTGAGNYTGTNTAYANVDGTNLSYTVTIPVGWKLAIISTGTTFQSTAVGGIVFALADGGTTLAPEMSVNPSAINLSEPVALATMITGDGNSHTITLQVKTGNAADAWNVANGSSTNTPTMVFILSPSN